MQQEILQQMLAQNRMTCSFTFDTITPANSGHRLTPQSASVGFIYRHIGETMHLFGSFFGIQTDVRNTTIGRQDAGQDYNLDESRRLIESGYEMLEQLIDKTSDAMWLDTVETPFFGTVSKVRLFSHVLYHTASHAGQISLTLSRGEAKT